MKMRMARYMMVFLLAVGASCAYGLNQKSYVQVVDQEPTTIAITASGNPSIVGQPVTFLAQLSPAGTGVVTFSITTSSAATEVNATPLESAQVALSASGKAAWTVVSPASGSYTVTAQYGGDANHVGSTASITEQVNNPGAPDFSIQIATGATVTPGQSWASLVTLTGVNGFNAPVTLSCGDGLDKTMGCSFQNATVTVSTNPVSETLTITTEGEAVTAVSGLLLPFTLIAFPRKRKAALSFVALGFLCVVIMGCGSHNGYQQSNGTPAGSYYVDVTATSGSISHTAEALVVVK